MANKHGARILELKQDDKSYAEIGAILTEETGSYVSKDMAQKWGQAALKEFERDNLTDNFRKYYGDSFKAPSYRPEQKDRIRVLTFGDMHGNPNTELFQYTDFTQYDVAVLGGDILDLAQLSSHAPYKNQQHRDINEEIASVRGFLQAIITVNPNLKIVLMQGNHDDRWLRVMHEQTHPAIRSLLPDPMDLIIHGMPQCSIAKTEIMIQNGPRGKKTSVGESSYIYPFGDVLMSHGAFLDAGRLRDWFNNMRRPMGLPDMTVYIQFHTHKLSHEITEGGWNHLISAGHAGEAGVEAYKYLGQKLVWKPGTPGIVTFDQTLEQGVWKTDTSTIKLGFI